MLRVRELGYKSQPCPDPVRPRGTQALLAMSATPNTLLSQQQQQENSSGGGGGNAGGYFSFNVNAPTFKSGGTGGGGWGTPGVSTPLHGNGGGGHCAYAARCDYCHPGEALRRVLPGSKLAAQGTYCDAEYTAYIKEEFPNNPAPWGFYV